MEWLSVIAWTAYQRRGDPRAARKLGEPYEGERGGNVTARSVSVGPAMMEGRSVGDSLPYEGNNSHEEQFAAIQFPRRGVCPRRNINLPWTWRSQDGTYCFPSRGAHCNHHSTPPNVRRGNDDVILCNVVFYCPEMSDVKVK